jgi:hypothetical protein
MVEQSSRQQVVYWVDLVRAAAIYLVVFIQVSGQLTNAWGKFR